MSSQQSARSVLMVSPSSFEFDQQTAESNKFMIKPRLAPSTVRSLALEEFRRAVATLKDADIDVIVHESDPAEFRPSAVFPNNWISTWPDGTVITYPMATPSRRVERDPLVLAQLASTHTIKEVTDISEAEKAGQHLESTGAIVFDHLNKIAYACISDRCDKELFIQHAKDLGYRPVAFYGYDDAGEAIYHTNVMLAIQTTTAVVCLEAIRDISERKLVHDMLAKHRDVIEISFDQMRAFCGNVLEVVNRQGDKYLIMSKTAHHGFRQSELKALSRDKTLLPVSIPTIELASGGSIRCMLAEIFLPKLHKTSAASKSSSSELAYS